MTQILTIIYVVVTMVLLFGAAVFVHEFGHYWVARRRGMKVEAFAIGFGPKILGWTKDGIEYSWRWIPAGGFVKLPQMITSEAIEGAAAADVPPASPLSRILVAFAGPMMNVVFAFFIATIIYFIGLPELVNPPIIGYVDPQSPEGKLGIREGDKIVSVNGEAVKSWQDVTTITVLARTNVLPVAIEHEGQSKVYSLTASINDQLDLKLKLLNLDPRDHPVVKSLESGGAGEKSGLKSGDEITSFDNIPISSREQLIQLIRKRPNIATEMYVKRGTEKVLLKVTPALDEKNNRGRIGVGLESSSKLTYILQTPGPTPWAQVSDVVQKTIDTIQALFYSKQTGVGIGDLSGPPGILAMLAAQINANFRLALSFLVLLNINLAIINLFPIPVLDGGHILIATIESIIRRPIHVRIIEYATTAFAVLLISFMAYVSFNDLKRFHLFKAMFQQETHIEQSEKPATPPGNAVPAPAPVPAPAK